MAVESQFKGSERFRIVRWIGAGGMGVVYEAFDKERNVPVALKTLPIRDADALFRFKKEFRSLTEISHPNLCPIYELISEGDTWFFTMELIDDPDGNFFPPARGLSKIPRRATEHRSRIIEGTRRAFAVDTPSLANPLATERTVPIHDDDATMVTRADDMATMVGGANESRTAAEMSDNLPSDYAPDFDRIRKVFEQIAEGVAALHRGGKLHRDLKPGNVMVRKSGCVMLLDFGLVAELGARVVMPGGEIGGNMMFSDRTISGTASYMSPEQAAGQPQGPATDWYAVGVMLFQALTGYLPFTGAANDVLRNKQLNDSPAPNTIRDDIPADLNDLCSALLTRHPEKRPGADEIIQRLSGAAASASALDGTHFEMPFVGRGNYLQQLDDAFAHSSAGFVCVKISGRSGTGKSTLIRRFIEKVAADRNTLVLIGRCYEQESVPYKALDSVVDALATHLMTVPVQTLAKLLPENSPSLVRIFPVLKRVGIFGVIDPELSADVWQVRRQAVQALRELLRALGQQHRLVLYIDDLQWGDTDSAELLAELVRGRNAPRMTMLLAYRSEYEQRSACLAALTDGGPNEIPAQKISVEPLTQAESEELATLLLGGDASHDLNRDRAAWIAKQSQGIAFFVYELARLLQTGGEAALNDVPDLDEVLWQRIGRLPDESRKLVELVAVAGKPVELRHVQGAAGMKGLSPQVITGLRQGLLVHTSGPSLADDISPFHDRIRESVLARLGSDTLRDHHAALATTMEAAGSTDAETLATHFEGGGNPAKASKYYVLAADTAVRTLAFKRAEELFRTAAKLATDPLARADIHEKMIHFLTDMARFPEAYAMGREACAPFGVKLPPKFIPPILIADFIASKIRLRGKTMTDVLNLPLMTNPGLTVAVRLINACAKAAYQVRPELCVSVSTRAVNLCLKHGNTPDCAIGYMVYGSIFQGGVMGNHKVGHEYGRLALDLVEKYGNAKQRAEVNFVVGYFGTSWLKPAREAEALWKTAWNSGIATHDYFHTGTAAAGIAMSQFMRGLPFTELLANIAKTEPVLQRAALREPLAIVTMIRQAVMNLQGGTKSSGTFAGSDDEETSIRRDLPKFGSRHFAHFFHVVRMQTHFLWGQHDKAEEHGVQSHGYLKDSPGMLHAAEHHFWRALNGAALGGKHTKLLGPAAKKFAKYSANCPENFEARAKILAGTALRLAGKNDAAKAAFEAALAAAETFGQPNIAGLAARELAAVDPANAAAHRVKAAAHFTKWGATALAKHVATEAAK